MKRLIATLVLATFAGIVSFNATSADDKPKAEDKKPLVGALPPHPLDGAFEKATTEKELKEALLNDPVYKKAILEALKAKQDVEAANRVRPIAGPSPASAARGAFLAALAGDK